MVTTGLGHLTELEKDAARYLNRIKQIDKLLRPSVETLIDFAFHADRSASGKYIFPALMSERHEFKADHSAATQALCLATLQRIRRLRRRFPHFDSEILKKVDGLDELLRPFQLDGTVSFERHVELLESSVFGTLNPLTASGVFRVLLEAGEEKVHHSLGFLAFFAMVWPLYRNYPPGSTGVRMEPWEPSAYITANCVLPILKLQRVINRRQNLWGKVKHALSDLAKQRSAPGNVSRHWMFALTLDNLSASLSRLSKLTIKGSALDELANDLERIAEGLHFKEADTERIYEKEIVKPMKKVMHEIGVASAHGLEQATRILASIDTDLLGDLHTRKPKSGDSRKATELLANKFGLKLSADYVHDPAYWDDLVSAGKKALEFSRELLEDVKSITEKCTKIDPDSSDATELAAAIDGLIKTNGDVARKIASAPWKDRITDWCRQVMNREIAYASAGNLTDFDGSELVSAIWVWTFSSRNARLCLIVSPNRTPTFEAWLKRFRLSSNDDCTKGARDRASLAWNSIMK